MTIVNNCCWLSTLAGNGKGYAVIGIAGRMEYVHRAAYIEWVGPIPDGLEIDHLCRIRNCIRPLHLEPVTHGENMTRGAIRRAADVGLITCPYAGCSPM